MVVFFLFPTEELVIIEWRVDNILVAHTGTPFDRNAIRLALSKSSVYRIPAKTAAIHHYTDGHTRANFKARKSHPIGKGFLVKPPTGRCYGQHQRR